jgi:hypothetical protein
VPMEDKTHPSLIIFSAMVEDACYHLRGLTLTKDEMHIVIEAIQRIEIELEISENITGVKLR